MAGLGLQSAKYLAIKAAIESHEAELIINEAIEQGTPPVCALDPLLSSVIANYSDEDQSIKSAGSIVAELLRLRGFTKGKQAACPGCGAAKSGAIWHKSSQ